MPDTPDILATEFMDAACLSPARDRYRVHYDPDLFAKRGDLLALVAGVRGLIVRNRTQVDAELLAAAPRLRVIGRLGVGLDNIDVEACAARDITVAPATGANDIAVAEWVIACLLMLIRGSYGARKAMLDGAWPRNDLIGGEIFGRVLGLVGFGGIARQVASRARAMGMRVSAYDPFIPPDDPAWRAVKRVDDLADMLPEVDALSLHVPLTPATRNLFDAGLLARLPAHAVLVNAARGGIVDESALRRALKSGRLAGAALDVYADEPLSARDAAQFHGIENLILTPHIAGVTAESNGRVSAVTVSNVLRILDPGPPLQP